MLSSKHTFQFHSYYHIPHMIYIYIVIMICKSIAKAVKCIRNLFVRSA